VKVKTSLTLPGDLLDLIDHADSNRSRFIEKAARHYLSAIGKAKPDEKDALILGAHSPRLNREALDVLEYQNLDA
jgi:metal-responsive CopG/Arc/MetJ family transcriptional regulator